MDIPDYSNRLADARESYHRKAEELKQNNEKNLQNLEATHKDKEVAQKSTYDRSLRDMENNTTRVTDGQATRSREEIDKLQQDYNRNMRTAREEFETKSAKERAHLSGRLGTLKEAYDTSMKESTQSNDAKLQDVKDRSFAQNQMGKVDSYNELEKLRKNSNEQYQTFRDLSAQEKRDVVKHKDDEIHSVVRNNSVEQGKNQVKHQQSMEELKRLQGDELHHIRNNQDDQMQSVRAINDEHSEASSEQYSRLMDRIMQRNDYEQKRMGREHDEQTRGMKKEFNKDIHMLERKANAIANNGGRGDSAKVELERSNKASEKRIEKLKSALNDSNFQAAEEKTKLMDLGQTNLRQQSLGHYKENDELAKKNAEYNVKVADKFNEQKDKIAGQYKGELKDTQYQNAKDQADVRISSRMRYDTMRDDYARRMNIMSQKNVDTISGIQEENAREKTAFIERAKRDVHTSKEELKGNLNSKFNKVVDSYEQKVGGLEHENKKKEVAFDTKINTLTKKATSELEHRTILEEQRRQEDIRTFKTIQENKDLEGAKTVQHIRQEFDKKLNEMRHNGEMQMDKMTRRYEEMIDRMNKEHGTEIHRRLGQSREHFERLAKTSEMEKEAITNKYELKIQKLKDSIDRARETSDSRNRTSSTSDDSGDSA